MFDLSQVFVELSHAVKSVELFPLFDAAHYILMTSAVREDLTGGTLSFARKHPLSCWVSSMLMCFAGGVLSNLLLGESLVEPFNDHKSVLLASAVWYAIFCSPFDIVYRLVKLWPMKIILTVAKEVQRTYKIHSGVVHAMKLYPSSYLIIIIIGTCKGAGSGLMRTFEQIIRGGWAPSSNEFLRPSFVTKACVAASLFFALEKKSNLLPALNATEDPIFLTVIVLFVYFKLAMLFFNVGDPFLPLENLFCAIFMGGLWDALNRAMTARRERRAGSADQANPSMAREAKKDS